MDTKLGSTLSWSGIRRRAARFAPLLCVVGVILMCFALYQLQSRWATVVNKKISNIDVIEAVPRPSPTTTPETHARLDSKFVTTIANNDLNERIWQLEQFQLRDHLFSYHASANSVQKIASNNSLGSSTVLPDMPPLPETKEQVTTYWPKEMSTSESQSVVIVLHNRAGAPIVPSIKVNTHLSAESNTLPVSKPEGEYDAHASAVLECNTFEAKLSSVESQSLKNARTEWIWNLATKPDRQVRGDQHLNAAIKVQFKDNSGKVVAEDQLWQGNIQISVYQNWFLKDLPNVTSLIGTICGAGLTVPWIYERVQKRRNKQVRRQRKRKGRRGAKRR